MTRDEILSLSGEELDALVAEKPTRRLGIRGNEPDGVLACEAREKLEKAVKEVSI